VAEVVAGKDRGAEKIQVRARGVKDMARWGTEVSLASTTVVQAMAKVDFEVRYT